MPFKTDAYTTELLDADVENPLSSEEESRLWILFCEIGRYWIGPDYDSAHQHSQWLEFIRTRTTVAPSYANEYRLAIRVLEELTHEHGLGVWKFVFGPSPEVSPTTGYGHFRKYVLNEFIRVWLTTGGFRVFGAGNYNSYVSGSRFAIKLPYRPLDS